MKHPLDRLTPGRKPGTGMGPKMKRALELVMVHGWTRTAAARESGVSVSGITQSRLYQDWAAKQAGNATQGSSKE